jgi:hypothetical protein
MRHDFRDTMKYYWSNAEQFYSEHLAADEITMLLKGKVVMC